MSFAGYAVAIELALKNNVGRGLAAITADFAGLNKHIAGAHGELDKFASKMAQIQRAGLMGAGIAGMGIGALSLLKGPYENAKAFEQAKVDFENLNLSAADNAAAFAQAAAMSHNVLGTSITENIKQINDLHTAFGDLHHALKASDAYAQFAFAAKIANGGVEVPGLTSASVKALEQRGGKVINDDATFLDELRLQSKVYFGSRGKVSGKDFFAASQTGGMAYTLLDKEYLYGPFAALMQAKSGATAGTAQMTEFSSLIGGHMDNKAKGFLADLGMLQVGVSKAQVALVNQAVGSLAMPQAEKNKLMKAMMPVTGALKDSLLGVAAHRPDLLVNDYLVPAIRKKFGMNMTDEEIGQLVTEKFNRGTSKLLGELIVNNLKFAKDAKIFTNAKDYMGAYQAYLKSPEGAEVAAEESWRNLSTMIGVVYIPKITEGLGSLAQGLDSLSIWTQKHPNLTKDLTGGFIGLGSAMAIGGTINVLSSGFKGLGLALEFANAGGATGIANVGSGLGVVGTGIAGVGRAITAFGLVYAAWQTGQVAGEMINNHLSQDQKDGIGHFLTEAMALAGDKDAQESLKLADPDSGALKFLHGVQNFRDATDRLDAIIADYRNKVLPTMAPPPPPKTYAGEPPRSKGPVKNDTDEKSNIQKIMDSINVSLSKLTVVVNASIDGKDVASHLIPGESTGPAGINTAAIRPNPGMSSYGLPHV